MDTFGKLNKLYDLLTSKDKDILNDDDVIQLRELLNDEMIELLRSIQTTFKSLNNLKDTNELHEMIQRKIDPQSNEDTLISATAQAAANIINKFGLGAVEKSALLKKYINALDIINRSVAIDHLSPEAALNKAVNETGLSKETLKVLGLFTSPFMGMVDLTVLGGYITVATIASPFVLLKKSAEYINTKYSERQERIAKEIEEQKNPELYLNIPVGLIISDIDADIKAITAARERKAKQIALRAERDDAKQKFLHNSKAQQNKIEERLFNKRTKLQEEFNKKREKMKRKMEKKYGNIEETPVSENEETPGSENDLTKLMTEVQVPRPRLSIRFEEHAKRGEGQG